MNFDVPLDASAAAISADSPEEHVLLSCADVNSLLAQSTAGGKMAFPFVPSDPGLAARFTLSNPLSSRQDILSNTAGIQSVMSLPFINGRIANLSEGLSHLAHRTVQTNSSFVGLPYQDHNYVAPLPCTPPCSPSISPAMFGVIGSSEVPSFDSISYHAAIHPASLLKEVVVTTTATRPSDSVTGDDSVTRCICDFQHDDGYMICCDKCGVWQHVDCMRVDRKNIPESYLCELCEPRLVDKHRAIQIQTKKRDDLALLLMDSSATETEDETTHEESSSLCSGSGHKNTRKEPDETGVVAGKRKRTKQVHDGESPKKKSHLKPKTQINGLAGNKILTSPQRSFCHHQSYSSDSFILPEDALNDSMHGSLPVTPTEALFAAVECVTAYKDANCNRYTHELQSLLASIRYSGHHTTGSQWPPVVGCSEIASHLAMQHPCRVASVGNSKVGLEASEDIITHQPLIEYIGNVMLRDQFDHTMSSSECVEPHALFYTKLDGLDLCIDARVYGNEARFVRRSCTPNAEVRHILDGSIIRFFVYATKSIIRGAEITIPFDFNYHKCLSYVECACTRLSCPVAKYQKQRELNQLSTRRQRLTKSVDTRLASTTFHDPSLVELLPTAPLKSLAQSSGMLDVQHKKTLLVPSSAASRSHSDVISDGTPTSREGELPLLVGSKDPPPILSPVKTTLAGVPVTIVTSTVVSVESYACTMTSAGHSDSDDGEKAKKKTREEKKLEAIVKAFERMEKREERKREALARLELAKKQLTKDKEMKAVKSEPVLSPPEAGCEQLIYKDTKQETLVSAAEQEEMKYEHSVKSRNRHVNSSCRPYMNIAVSVTSSESHANPVFSTPVSSTFPPPLLMMDMVANTVVNSCNEEYLSPTVSCLSPNTTDYSVSDCQPILTTSDRPICFPKKLMMRGHESRRFSTSDVCKPLAVQTDMLENGDSSAGGDAEYVTCVPSPHTFSLSSLRRDGVTRRAAAMSALSATGGSAKKRWLQKAMFDSTTESSTVASPACLTAISTTGSPCHSVVTADTVCTPTTLSPTGDFVTPLKKRRLARESLSIDGSLPGITEDDGPGLRTATPPASIPLAEPSGHSFANGNLKESPCNTQDKVWPQIVTSSVPKFPVDIADGLCSVSARSHVPSVTVTNSAVPAVSDWQQRQFVDTLVTSPRRCAVTVEMPYCYTSAINAAFDSDSSVVSLPFTVFSSTVTYMPSIPVTNVKHFALAHGPSPGQHCKSHACPLPSADIENDCWVSETSNIYSSKLIAMGAHVPSCSITTPSNIVDKENPQSDISVQTNDNSTLPVSHVYLECSEECNAKINSVPLKTNGSPLQENPSLRCSWTSPDNFDTHGDLTVKNVSQSPDNSIHCRSLQVVTSPMETTVMSWDVSNMAADCCWKHTEKHPDTQLSPPTKISSCQHFYQYDLELSASCNSVSSCTSNTAESPWNLPVTTPDPFAVICLPPRQETNAVEPGIDSVVHVPLSSDVAVSNQVSNVISTFAWSSNAGIESIGNFTDAATVRCETSLGSSAPVAPMCKKKVSLVEYRQRMSQRSGENATMSPVQQLTAVQSVLDAPEDFPSAGALHLSACVDSESSNIQEIPRRCPSLDVIHRYLTADTAHTASSSGIDTSRCKSVPVITGGQSSGTSASHKLCSSIVPCQQVLTVDDGSLLSQTELIPNCFRHTDEPSAGLDLETSRGQFTMNALLT